MRAVSLLTPSLPQKSTLARDPVTAASGSMTQITSFPTAFVSLDIFKIQKDDKSNEDYLVKITVLKPSLKKVEESMNKVNVLRKKGFFYLVF